MNAIPNVFNINGFRSITEIEKLIDPSIPKKYFENRKTAEDNLILRFQRYIIGATARNRKNAGDAFSGFGGSYSEDEGGNNSNARDSNYYGSKSSNRNGDDSKTIELTDSISDNSNYEMDSSTDESKMPESDKKFIKGCESTCDEFDVSLTESQLKLINNYLALDSKANGKKFIEDFNSIRGLF